MCYTMRKYKRWSKFVLFIPLILLCYAIFDSIFSKNNLNEHSAAIYIKFDQYVDSEWITGLHKFVADNIENDKNLLTRSMFTKHVARCNTTCNYNIENLNFFLDNQCKTQPVLLNDRQEIPKLLSTVIFAEATIPCFLKLTQSHIPNAGRGIFSRNYKIPKGFTFGPYKGIIRNKYDANGWKAREAGYAWTIFGDKESNDFVIDGEDENVSNWLRYVNTARYEEEQNLFPFVHNQTVYYYLYKNVEPNTELLIWYGENFAKRAEIYVATNSSYKWDSGFAPPIAETICQSCPIKKKDEIKSTFKSVYSDYSNAENRKPVSRYLSVKKKLKEYFVYKLMFKERMDETWIAELQTIVLLYFPEWEKDFGNFTKHVAHCMSVCNENVISDKIHVDVRCKSSKPLIIFDNEVMDENLKTVTKAHATVPCFLNLSKSKIPNANRGIFAKRKLSRGVVFGPYTGLQLSAYGEEAVRAKDGGFTWKIFRYKSNGDEDHFYVDGQYENSSNWLRWVNSARYYEEQNMVPLYVNHSIYYMTFKDVEPGTELLIWYGTAYAQNGLKIFTIKGSKHDWENDFAPNKDIVICPTCPRTDGEVSGEHKKPAYSTEDSVQNSYEKL